MNYYGFCGYWFYGGPSSTPSKIASFFASWGLIEVAAATDIISKAIVMYYRRLMTP